MTRLAEPPPCYTKPEVPVFDDPVVAIATGPVADADHGMVDPAVGAIRVVEHAAFVVPVNTCLVNVEEELT